MHDRTVTHMVLAVLLVLVVVLGVVTLASRPAAPASCARSSDYGTQCESLTGTGLIMTGLEARLRLPDVFDQHE